MGTLNFHETIRSRNKIYDYEVPFKHGSNELCGSHERSGVLYMKCGLELGLKYLKSPKQCYYEFLFEDPFLCENKIESEKVVKNNDDVTKLLQGL